MFVFIAGAMIIGFLKAAAIEVKRLSQIPAANFERVFALKGAIIKASAQLQRLMCSVLSLGSNCPSYTRSQLRVSRVKGVTKFLAPGVITTFVL